MSSKNIVKIIKRRFKCSKCKSIESHSLTSNKTSCYKCGSPLIEISEKEYIQYKNKLKKDLEEDIKETNKEEKKKKKSNKNIIKEDTDSEYKEKKEKRKLRKNLSQRNLKDKDYKESKSKKMEEENEEDAEDGSETKKSKRKKEGKKGKKKNRNKSVCNLGNYINNIVSNVLGNLGIDGVGNIDFGNLQNVDGSTIIINQNNNSPMQIVVNNQNVSSEVFDPIFSQFGSIFNDNFVNNFSSNFASNFNGDFFDQVQSIIENNQQESAKHGPTEDKNLKKLKRFQLTSKYCKKGKNGKIELPNCCICLSEIAKGKETVLLPCGHMFHWKCCLNWLKKNNTCPMCRFEIK